MEKEATPTEGTPIKPQPTRELTFGEKLVGVTFNPSQRPDVARIKELGAEMADIVLKHKETGTGTYVDNIMHGSAFQEIKSATMFAVGALTNQH